MHYEKVFLAIKKQTKLFSFLGVLVFFNLNAQQISFCHLDKTLEEIQSSSIEWQNYDKPIYEGPDNGIYWFKIKLEDNAPKILHIPESHVSRANLYHQNKEIKRETKTRYVTFKIENNRASNNIYYLKVNCLLEARIPLKIDSPKEYYRTEIKDFVITSIYTGVVICIIIFNLFLFFSYKNRVYLYYIFMVIGMYLNAFYKDGISALIFGIKGINETLETTLNEIVVISAVFFCTKYLSLKENLPKLRLIGIYVAVLSLTCNILFQLTKNFYLFTITDVLHLLALDVFWFAGVFLWKKSIDARFFTIAYGIPLLFLSLIHI